MQRTKFAERIGASLAGWFQQLAAQDLHTQVGEDAARVELIRTIGALRSYIPDTSARPTNWPLTTKKRVDVAVLGRSATAEGWYGAIELKWPKGADIENTRYKIVQDALRVAFSDTANLCANFVVLGATTEALAALFDGTHTVSRLRRQKTAFNSLFSRKLCTPEGRLTNVELNANFPDCGDRVPQTVFNGWSRRFKTELISRSDAKVGEDEKGSVFVWQCYK